MSVVCDMSNKKVAKLDNRWILYNPELMPEPLAEFFCCKALYKKDRVVGSAGGRGETCFYKVEEKIWALRHYLRGGLIAKLLFDQYLGVRLKNTRAWKEWHLLAEMSRLDLPVPVPVAASVTKHGFFYRADLVTVYIENTQDLAEVLETKRLDKELWKQIGNCIRQFHNKSVFHSDLNAKNILLDQNNTIYLIDFDQCGFKKGNNWKQDNLLRLKRSLDKFNTKMEVFHFDDSNWKALKEGYDADN